MQTIKLKETIATGLFCLLFLVSHGQVKPVFEATVDAKKVQLGDYFEATFVVENGDVSEFTPPNFNDFMVLDQSSGSSMSIANGKVSRTNRYNFTLQPKRVGRLYVRPATAKINGKSYKTKSVLVEAVKAGQKGSKDEALSRFEAGKGVFIRAEVDSSKKFLGQQIIVDYKIYTSVGLSSYVPINDPEFEGVYAQTLQYFSNQIIGEIVDNIPYKTKVLRRVAIFPQKSGLIKIPPLQVRVGVNIPGLRRSQRKVIESDPVVLNILLLPEKGKPDNFSGAVGSFDLVPRIGNTTITTDETVSLQLEIIGEGDVKQIQAPDLGLAPESFEVFEPTFKEDAYEQNGVIGGKKIFEYSILPKKPGTYNFTPSFSYFDPDSLKYITLAPETYPIDVGMGSNPISSGRINMEQKKTLREQMKVANFSRQGQYFLGSLPFWAVLAFPFLFLLGVVGYKRKQIRLGNIDPTLLKQERAQQEAKKRLQKAKKLLDEKQNKAFYKEISDALWGYISDKLNIPTSELSRNNISEKLVEKQVAPAQVDAFLGLLNTCDMALFAAMENEEERTATYQDTMTVVMSIEEQLMKEN